MTLDAGIGFVVESVPLGKASFDAAEEEGVTKINLVTWDLSSVFGRLTPVLLVNSL